MDSEAPAERAAGYLLEHAGRVSGPRLRQGAWDGAFAAEAGRFAAELGDARGSLKFLTRYRLRSVPRRAIRALFAWARGFPVELRLDVPSALEVLRLQASGSRCVSLLPEHASTAPHANGLDFLIHDLCHLDKFAASEHHEEQVGFFATLHALASDGAYRELEALLDPTFIEERERLGSDVNGSAVYLFALLKMKLKMAARRRRARLVGLPPSLSGTLDAGEQAVFEELEELLYASLRFDGALRNAARETSARRDAMAAAAVVASEFRARGRAVLAR